MTEIVLATLNAKYLHAAFGLRYLLANMGALRERTEIAEFDINQRPLEIAERLLALEPRILGLGVYIWNIVQTTELVALLKRIRPELIIVLGGPEVSYETDQQEIVRLADYVITGEADVAFGALCQRLLEGEDRAGLAKVSAAELPALAGLALPYQYYTDEDLAHRVIYVEVSRGCPFTCEFCLSSLDIPVRQFALEKFLQAMDGLIARGAQQFKFVDRTFNLHLPTSRAILQFFLDRWRDGMFVHFEMVPDRLPDQLRELLAQFPAGGVQLEVGIQTFNEAASKNISRRQNVAKLEDNFRYLRANTGVHIHADLIVGLPGEDLASFGRGFDRLLAMGPQEIQVGILKRLRGTPIVRHDAEFAMTYSGHAPYDVLQTKDVDFPTMQRLRRFARFWDLLGNSGNFLVTVPLLWGAEGSPFEAFLKFSDWLHARLRRTHQIALETLARELFGFLTTVAGVELGKAAEALATDWRRGGRKDLPPWLAEHTPVEGGLRTGRIAGAKRQARHVEVALAGEGRVG
jgi:radical SAM superfamily enzyme YgiQ (UPF0313 family)